MDRPSRRAFAAIALSALAGCASVTDDSSSNGGPTNDSDATSGSDTGGRDGSNCPQTLASPDPYPDLEIASDPVPEEADVGICVTPTDPFTDDSPARIAFEFTNRSDSEQEYAFGHSPPFSPGSAEHEDSDGTLYVLPDDRAHVSVGGVPEAPTDGCWRAEGPFSADDLIRWETVAPGETISERYTLLAGPDGGCLATGTYRAAQSYNPVDDTWGVEITLSA